jgi:surface antigen
MRGKILLLGSLLTIGCFVLTAPAEASRSHDVIHHVSARSTTEHAHAGHAVRVAHADRVVVHAGRGVHGAHAGHGLRLAHSNSKYPLGKTAKAHYSGGPVLQCVSFARAASGIELKGNAANWWDAADGVYQRGHRPEPGSVLNFRATGRMRLGHVAVVHAIINAHEIEIDQANWVSAGRKGNITRGTRVIDVSERNDWSAVRVQMVGGGDFGSVYPTYGFIYDRPDNGTVLANAPAATSHHGVRPVAFDEVAQAPAGRSAPSNIEPATFDVPDRSIR